MAYTEIPEDYREVSGLTPDRLYSVIMPDANFNAVVGGITFTDSVSFGALTWEQVLKLRAYGFQVHIYPFTVGLKVAWKMGRKNLEPVAYTGEPPPPPEEKPKAVPKAKGKPKAKKK